MRVLKLVPWRAFLYYLFTGLILIGPALMNMYPLVYSDSGTYMASSRHLYAPIDRPIGYGLIIRAVTWQSTMWTVVIFQGMVASWLVRECLRTLFPTLRNAWRPHVLVLVVLLIGTSLPWYTSQLMPDVLSGFLALCFFLLLFGRQLAFGKTILLWVLLFFFTITHLSYIPMMIAAALLTVIAAWRWGRAPRRKRLRLTLTGLLALPLIGSVFIMYTNRQEGNGWVLSPTSSLFLSGKLIESGAMRLHLERVCRTAPNFLCAHLDELNTTGMHYVWDDDAPTRQGLGLVDASKRLDPLVSEVLSDPRNWPMLIWSSCIATASQTAQVDVGSGLGPYREGSAPYHPMLHDLPHELPNYMNSLQQRGVLSFEAINFVARPVLLGALACLLTLWPSCRRTRWWAFCMVMIGFVVLNAAATGALANLYDRLQARITWLVIFAALLLVLQRFQWARALFLFPTSGGSRNSG